MSQFRSKRLDIGGFVNKWVIRDHTKRKVFAEYETDRYVLCLSSKLPPSRPLRDPEACSMQRMVFIMEANILV